MIHSLQIFDLFSDLSLDSAPPDLLVQVLGNTVLGDSGRGWYKYDATSVVADDGFNTIRPTGFSVGAWIRTTLPISPAFYYDNTGIIAPPTKNWIKIVTPSTSNGYSIDISSAGFSSIIGIKILTIKNNSTANLSSNVSVKTWTTSSVVVNIVEGNANTVSILGINVLSGAPLVFANVTGLTLSVEITGY